MVHSADFPAKEHLPTLCRVQCLFNLSKHVYTGKRSLSRAG